MFLKMLDNIGTAVGPYRRDVVYDVVEEIAADWIRAGHAEPSAVPPVGIANLLAKLEDGAGKECVFLPFTGEFGHLIMSHIRLVHFHKASRKVVCCWPGQEVLFPSADEFVTDWIHPIPDFFRVGTTRNLKFNWPLILKALPDLYPIEAGGLTPAQEIFPLFPKVKIPFRPRIRRTFIADVCIGVRERAFCPERNWQHWQSVADALTAAGKSFAVIGARPTSFDLKGQTCLSGDYDTDTAIELIQNCRLYIGTDSGSSHLASTVEADMLLFRETAGGSRDLTSRMKAVNRGNTTVLANGWTNPRAVIDCALSLLH